MAEFQHDCPDCTHQQIGKAGIKVLFEIEGIEDDLPSPYDLVSALSEGLPREWWADQPGADWWVVSLLPLGHNGYPLPVR